MSGAQPQPVGFDLLFQPYTDGLASGELRIPQCSDCQGFQWPPRSVCMRCSGDAFTWITVQRPTGTLFSWTVVHHAKGTEFEELVPYAVGLIELPDYGVRLYGLIPDPAGLEIDATMKWEPPRSPNDSAQPFNSATVPLNVWKQVPAT